MNPQFWHDRRVLLTGHTGFKGAWLARLLTRLGARVTGLSLAPSGSPNLYSEMAPWHDIDSRIGDIRSKEQVAQTVEASAPEVIIHLASQALVRLAFSDPYLTFSVNVAGTVNLLHQVLEIVPTPTVILVVTTDKVYGGDENGRPFRETDGLNARDPYGASKVGQELAAAMFRSSYLEGTDTRLATARSGNVIGGGDWAPDRLVPDFFRARNAGRPVELRNPSAVRPWQHVLDVINGYLMYVEFLSRNREPLTLNFAPPEADARDVRSLVEQLAGTSDAWVHHGSVWPETHALRLDGGLASRALGWRPVLSFETSVRWTLDWYEHHARGDDARQLTTNQIDRFLGSL